jgi:hypothetical protein
MKNLIKRLSKLAEELSDNVSDMAAKPWFIMIHIIWWGVWIGFKIEPFPFGLLTLFVSLEAIILSGLLLSSGNREGEQEKKIARKDLRISTETNVISEEILEIVRDLQEDIRALKDSED